MKSVLVDLLLLCPTSFVSISFLPDLQLSACLLTDLSICFIAPINHTQWPVVHLHLSSFGAYIAAGAITSRPHLRTSFPHLAGSAPSNTDRRPHFHTVVDTRLPCHRCRFLALIVPSWCLPGSRPVSSADAPAKYSSALQHSSWRIGVEGRAHGPPTQGHSGQLCRRMLC